mgnify:FL=1
MTDSIFSGIIGSVIFPLLIAGLGALAAVAAVWFVRVRNWNNPQLALSVSTYVAAGLMLLATLLFSQIIFDGVRAWSVFGAVATGLIVGIGIGCCSDDTRRS